MTWMLLVVFLSGYNIKTELFTGYKSEDACKKAGSAMATVDQGKVTIQPICLPAP